MNDKDLCPQEEQSAQCKLFFFAALADKIKGKIYMDLPGCFPTRSYKGNQYIFLTYVYNANAILVRPMKSRAKEEQLEKIKEIYDYLKRKKFNPILHVMDNECSKLIQEHIQNSHVTLQLVEPNQHRVIAAERAIQTFKNHFIAGLCTVDNKFPMQLWCDLLPRVEMTVNLLRQAQTNNKLSAYTVLEGAYNFNKVPLAPLGSKVFLYQDPKTRRTWSPHA